MICKKRKCPQPSVVAILSEISTEYFILCENVCLCKVSRLSYAIFVMFSCYYCFNLDYSITAKNSFLFFQDYILGHPDPTKKTGTYIATVSDINSYL